MKKFILSMFMLVLFVGLGSSFKPAPDPAPVPQSELAMEIQAMTYDLQMEMYEMVAPPAVAAEEQYSHYYEFHIPMGTHEIVTIVYWNKWEEGQAAIAANCAPWGYYREFIRVWAWGETFASPYWCSGVPIGTD